MELNAYKIIWIFMYPSYGKVIIKDLKKVQKKGFLTLNNALIRYCPSKSFAVDILKKNTEIISSLQMYNDNG